MKTEKKEKPKEEEEEEEEEKFNEFKSLIREGSLCLELVTLREDGTFLAGDLIKCLVKLQLTKPLVVKDFKIHLKGILKSKWTDTVGPKRKQECEVQKEIAHLKEEIKTKKPSQDGSVSFGIGFYSVPVKFDLPDDIMSSFESSRGFIRYYISVRGIVEDKPLLFHHQRIKIVVPLDLSQDPMNLIPIRLIEHQDVVACCCYRGKLMGRLQIDRRAYVPGEYVTVTGMITNHTNKDMAYSKCSLNLKMTYIKDNWNQKCKKVVLAFVKHGRTKAGENDYWEDVQLKIPSHMPPALLNCKYIQIKYLLKVEAKMAWTFPSEHTLFNVILPVGHISAKPQEEEEEEGEEEEETDEDGDMKNEKEDELIELEV